MPAVPPLSEILRVLSPRRPQALVLTPKALDVASSLRGGSGATEDLLRQLAGQPGVKAADVRQLFGHLDPASKLTPLQLAAAARVPKLFAQRGVMRGVNEDEQLEQIADLAHEILYSSSFQEARRKVLSDALFEHVDPEVFNLLGRHQGPLTEEQMRQLLAHRGVDASDLFFDKGLVDNAQDLAHEQLNDTTLFEKQVQWSPQFQGYQRQKDIATPGNEGYFETVLRTAPSRALGMKAATESAHFNNPGILGHVRGTANPQAGRISVEEIQSDPLEYYAKAGLDLPPELQGVYGKLGKMMVDRTANAPGISTLSFPTAERIAAARPPTEGSLKAFQSIYDRQTAKQVLDPLAKAGLPIEHTNGWYDVEFPEAAKEMIRAGKSPATQYRQGGLALCP